ncbi:hypothetical protein B0T10DRAFT_137204 [Thelonectria olida]|uniref:PDZ domain-containing protein n=1 Tax=Thelonectria olida TaxID=1576542 RepID=A0A9P8VXF1_9HYPO|nr:hypothetical protein B0T10DRAFT_137204 [Thelonectria olida]
MAWRGHILLLLIILQYGLSDFDQLAVKRNGSPAHQSGLEIGESIIEINDTRTADIESLGRVVRQIADQFSLRLRVVNSRGERCTLIITTDDHYSPFREFKKIDGEWEEDTPSWSRG